MPLPTLDLVFVLLLLATLFLPGRRAALAGAALVAWAIGAGAFARVPGIIEIPALAARLDAVGLSPVFVGMNTGLLLLGAGTLTALGLWSVAEHLPMRTRAASACVVTAGALALASIVPLLRVAKLDAALAAAACLAAAVLAALVERAVSRALPRLQPRSPSPTHRAPLGRAGAIGIVVALVGAVLVLAAPHVGAIIAGALLAAAGAHVTWRSAGGSRVPALPISTLALLPFIWLLGTIAGPVGLGTASLPMVPLSPPAQALLAPALVAGAWGFLGLWPLHRWVPGPVLAPLGGALLLRAGAPSLGAGFEHVQPAFFALAALAAWHAALARRTAALAASIGFAAFAAIFAEAHVAPGARIAAAVLFACATVLALLEHRPGFAMPPAARFWTRRLVAFASGVAAYAAIGAGLRAEVVLTLLIAVAAAVGITRARASEVPS